MQVVLGVAAVRGEKTMFDQSTKMLFEIIRMVVYIYCTQACRLVNLTCPNTPVLVVAPNGEVLWPKAGVDCCCPKGEGDVVPKGLELAPKPAN